MSGEQPPKDPVPDQADPDDPIVVGPEPDPPPAAPTPKEGDAVIPHVTGILPNNVKVGGEDLTLAVYGSGFSEDTVILLDGEEQPTDFVDSTRVTTIVEPSTVSGPMIIPITVAGAGEAFNFAFSPEDPSDPNTYTDADSPIGGGPLV